MQAIEILDIKTFMQLLFQTNTLDAYAFVSSELKTDMSYTIDGRIQRSFFSDEEIETLNLTQYTHLPWKLAKERIFSLIRGRKIPSNLKIVLRLCEADMTSFLSCANSSLTPADINGIFLNILFGENHLTITTGISYKIFTLDKSLESELSAFVLHLLKPYKITCQVLD